MTQIASVDYSTLRITLHVDTVTQGFDPALMQQEYRALRRTVEANRQYDPMVSFQGLESKGGGNFTPGQTLLRAGVRIIPHDADQQLDILNEILNIPDGLADRNVFDRTGIVSNVDIDPVYSPVEVREVSTGSGLTATEQLQLAEIHGQIEREIWINTNGPPGNGYQQSPYNTLAAALNDAASNGIRAFVLLSNITLDRNVASYQFRGIGNPTISLSNFNVGGTQFKNVTLAGTPNQAIVAHDCDLADGLTVEGHYDRCTLLGDITCRANSSVLIINSASGIPGLGRPSISMSDQTTGLGVKLSVRGFHGGFTVKDCNNANDAVTVEIDRGSLTFDASNTDGVMVARTSGKFVDSSNGAMVTKEIFVQDTWQAAKQDPDNPVETDEDGTIRVAGRTIQSATVGTTPNRTTTQTRVG